MFLKKNKKNNPYIIAEIGNNHNGSVELAKKMIVAAKQSGADCVKFQTFSTNSLFSKNFLDKNIGLKKDSDKFTLKLKDFEKLSKFAKKIKLHFTATPFSNIEVDYLIDYLKVKFVKIASMDLNNHPFIKYIAKKKIPIILSTGFGTEKEISDAVKLIKKYNSKLAILHCVSEYPPQIKKLNLNRIKILKAKFKIPVGFSDHTIGVNASCIAMTLGAQIIEKHFTLNKKMKGWDHPISADILDMESICKFSKNLKKILGSEKIYRVESVNKKKLFRRSIVANKYLNKGKKLSLNDLNFKRPGNGIGPNNYKKILGKFTNKNIKKDELIKFKFLK